MCSKASQWSISHAKVRLKVTSFEFCFFTRKVSSYTHTHTYIPNTPLSDCTNGRILSQTEKGCMQNKEKGTLTLGVCTKGSPILSKSHLEPTAERVQRSVPQWSLADFKPCSIGLSRCLREHTISIFRVTESEHKESMILQTIRTGLHYVLWRLKHHNHWNNYCENQKQLKLMPQLEAQT